MHVTGWISVSVIAAYLTFFPVAITTLRGLHSADHRAVELMRSYAAEPLDGALEAAVPASLPYLFTALRVVGDGERRRRDHRRAAVVDRGRPRRRDPQLRAVLHLQPQKLWATNIIAALLGIAFFLIVAAAEKLVVRRAPENVGMSARRSISITA